MSNNEFRPAKHSHIERHYWKAVAFLVVLILIGSGFWGLRRFSPALFLGKPDFIAVPEERRLSEQVDGNSGTDNKNLDFALLNINTATATQLQTLPKIGPQTAHKIIQYREKHGRFASIDALGNVKGIGEKTLAQLKPFITVE